MSKIIKINEDKFNKLILKEGTTDQMVMDMWDEAAGVMGADAMLDALYKFLDTDTIQNFVETLKREYELPIGQEYDEEEELYF